MVRKIFVYTREEVNKMAAGPSHLKTDNSIDTDEKDDLNELESLANP